LEAIATKVLTLNQSSDVEEESEEPRVFRKGQVLVVDTSPLPGLDFNTFISDLREKRIHELSGW